MSALAWGVGSATAVVCFALVMAWRRSLETNAARAERASRPAALRNAELVYMERLFRISTPVGLVAKLDRAYRMPSGLLVLVEFKTRWSKPPSQNDCTLPPVTTHNLPAFPITFRQCWVDIFGIGARPNRKQENPLRPFDCFLGEGQLHESCDWRGKCHCRLIGLNCH